MSIIGGSATGIGTGAGVALGVFITSNPLGWIFGGLCAAAGAIGVGIYVVEKAKKENK